MSMERNEGHEEEEEEEDLIIWHVQIKVSNHFETPSDPSEMKAVSLENFILIPTVFYSVYLFGSDIHIIGSKIPIDLYLPK